ncbi:MAG TPA: transporter substrate-binding domain-containing protein [Geminicoccaceae bacterium]|nr:transporter substrate-binding domain-containing protein [Geminicoccaceae bacterium]
MKRGYPLKAVGEPLFKEPPAVAVDKGDPEFVEKIKGIVEAVHADGTIKRLSEKWYGADLSS